MNVCRANAILFAIAVVGMFSRPDHWFRVVSGVATLILIVFGLLGAGLGLQFAFGKLHFGCPLCGRKGEVIVANKKEMWMKCPGCGEIRVSSLFLGRLKVEKMGHGEGV